MSPRISAEHGLQQRERILEAAAVCFCRKGYHETTVQDICDEAHLSKGGLYTYFKSKDEMLAALIEESFLGTLREAQQAVEGIETSVEKLDRVANLIIDRLVAPDRPPTYSPQLHLEMWAEASKHPHLHALIAEGYERWRSFVADLLRQGIAQGELRSEVDPDALAAILVAVFDGLSLQESVTKTKVDWLRVAAALRLGLGEGILTEAARESDQRAGRIGGRQ